MYFLLLILHGFKALILVCPLILFLPSFVLFIMVFESSKDMEIIDSSNPYHLHPSDHPSIMLVSKSLDGDNYGTWSRSMTIAPSAKDKIEFIDVSIIRPSHTNAKFSSWKWCINMVLSWILNTMDLNLANSYIHWFGCWSLDKFQRKISSKEYTKDLSKSIGKLYLIIKKRCLLWLISQNCNDSFLFEC